MAILRFLGHKHGMAPKTEEERTRADLVAEQLLDLRNGFVKLCYGEDYVSSPSLSSTPPPHPPLIPSTFPFYRRRCAPATWRPSRSS